jgi:hypothetical protein
VVANGGTHGATTATGTVKLAPGMHRLRLRYFQGDGSMAFEAGLMAGARPGCLRLLVDRGGRLVMDGSGLGMAEKVVPIPQAVRDAMVAAGLMLALPRIASIRDRVSPQARAEILKRLRQVTQS